MKKWISLVLALVCFACCFGAAAEQEDAVENFPVMGLKFTYPQEFIDAKGCVSTDGPAALADGIYYAYWYYVALPPEEFNRLLMTDQEKINEKAAMMYYVFAVPGKKDFSAVNELTGNALDTQNAYEIGKAGDWTFYLYMDTDPEYEGTVDQAYYDEYTDLCGMKDKIAAAYTFSEPFNEYSGNMDGAVISFTATDLDGNPVSSEEIFAQNKVTMVNIWATWCGPCISELGELQKINARFREKDCAIVGLLIDKDINEAKRLVKENGITYRVVIAPDNFDAIFPFEAVPTSFYVDSKGHFLGTKIVGVQTDMYESALEPLLEAAQ